MCRAVARPVGTRAVVTSLRAMRRIRRRFGGSVHRAATTATFPGGRTRFAIVDGTADHGWAFAVPASVWNFFDREVRPHVPDAWIDHSKTKIGYEIPFTRHFYVYKPPRPLAEIDAELKALEAEIQALLNEVTG